MMLWTLNVFPSALSLSENANRKKEFQLSFYVKPFAGRLMMTLCL